MSHSYIHRFPGQKENEKIKFLVTKHWIVYVKLFGFLLMMAGIPFAAYLIIEISVEFSPNASRILLMLFLLYFNYILLAMYIRWLEDEMDILIVTSERIISIDQTSFMTRTISETELSQIQDVYYRAKGVLSNIIGFGFLEVQTAAEKTSFEIDDVPKPYIMARKILDTRDEFRKHFYEETGIQTGHMPPPEGTPGMSPLVSPTPDE